MLTIRPSSICLVSALAISTGWICRLNARPKTPSTSDSIRFSMFLRMPKEPYPLTLATRYRNTAYIIAARPSEITASVRRPAKSRRPAARIRGPRPPLPRRARRATARSTPRARPRAPSPPTARTGAERRGGTAGCTPGSVRTTRRAPGCSATGITSNWTPE